VSGHPPRHIACTRCGYEIIYDEVKSDNGRRGVEMHDDILFLDGQRIGRAEATGAVLCGKCEEET
jgi:hypothetical protein